ncbi:MAG: magnesium transporter MgtE, partial [Chloroflexi bacterium]|nr:magnesium transporter MgtE [Chloroflexota bacterium]
MTTPAPSTPFVFPLAGLLVSQLLGRPVLGQVRELVGTLRDLVVQIETAPYPIVKGIVVHIGGSSGHPFFIHERHVADLSADAVLLRTSAVNLQPFVRRDGEALLAKDVLDKQIIDVSGRRVVRANDIQLAFQRETWRVVAADVSMAGFAARVAPQAWMRWIERRWRRELLPWEGVEFFGADVPGVRISLPHDKLRTLHPADLAVLLRELSYEQGSEALAALDEEAAADAVEVLDPPLQAALLSKMAPGRAADILEEMDPDDAADLVNELPEEQADALVAAIDPEYAAELTRLASYEEGSAGSIMT